MQFANACGTNILPTASLHGTTLKASSLAVPETNVSASHLSEILDARAATTASAVTERDPGAELMLQQTESSLLNEESMYTLLQHDSLDSPRSYRWSLQPSKLIKSALGWLSNQVKRWQQVPLSELQVCLRYILGLLPQEVSSSENQRLWQMQPSVVSAFCRAMVAAQLPYTSVFRNTAKVWTVHDRIVWEFETIGMPVLSIG